MYKFLFLCSLMYSCSSVSHFYHVIHKKRIDCSFNVKNDTHYSVCWFTFTKCHIGLVFIIFSLFCHQVKIPSSVHVWISCASAVFSTRAEELKHVAASYCTVLEVLKQDLVSLVEGWSNKQEWPIMNLMRKST